MSAPLEPQPPGAEESASLSETASKLERLREMTRKYSASEGSIREEESEQALETHEVVELQAFIRHKEWIEEKILFLEGLPRIDIFAGVDELSKTHDQITTLATRAQLDGWVAEHDNIEKETEVLDAGDFRKLKALTKAATQRNLSREDTDLVEITLTTLFAFDKLIHLLRDRSEQLDLFDSRLTWEEQRALAYSTRSGLLSQIQSFLDNRGRWTTRIYSDNSVPTLSSNTNPLFGSEPSEAYDPFSRSARFKLSEALSRDVIQLSSKISSLHHGPVMSSGRALDKLIEDSRDPVPDTMLDEQDRVEEKCEKHLSSIGKFLMSVNLQWKKADETYVETRKDVAALQALSDEIQASLIQLPSRKTEIMFSNRIEAIRKRLESRMEQSLPAALPLPKHGLFPDQESFNAELVNILSNELRQARSFLSNVDSIVSSYRAGCDVLDEAETLRKEFQDLQAELLSTTERLRNGFDADDGNGSPPDLTQDLCVEPLRFSAFLAALPSLSERSSQMEDSATKTVKRARVATLRFNKPGITNSFRQDFFRVIEDVEEQVRTMVGIRNEVFTNVDRLREVRCIWSAMDQVTKSIDAVTPELREALLKNQWKQQIGGDSAPPTPESPTAELPATAVTPDSINAQIVSAKELFEQDVSSPLSTIRNKIPSSLHEFICTRQLSIERSLFDLRTMHRLLVDVHGQKYAMETIKEEVHFLEGRIEDSKTNYDEHFDSMLRSIDLDSESPPTDQADGTIDAREQSLSHSVDSIQNDVNTLVDSLPTRVPLISRASPPPAETTSSGGSRTSLASRLPFKPASVDRSVRNDANAYAMRLTSGVKSLQQKRSFGPFYRVARDMSKRTILAHKDMRVLTDQLEQHARELEELADAHLESGDDGMSAITALKDSLEDLEKTEAERLNSLVCAIRDDISRMETVTGVQEDSIAWAVLRARHQTLDEIHAHSQRIRDRLEALKVEVAKAEQTELANLAEIARQEKEAAEAQLKEQIRCQKEKEEAEKRVRERLEKQSIFRVQEESTPKPAVRRGGFPLEEDNSFDVFGPDNPSRQAIDKETADLLALVRSLRKQLKSIGLNSVVRPSGASRHRSPSASLPQPETAEAMTSDFTILEAETNKLPVSAENITADTELRSLRLEMEASRDLLNRVKQLAQLQSSVAQCDAAFSTFLDYIDSYPNAPPSPNEIAVVSLKVNALESPEERLSEKMSYAKGIFGDVNEHFAPVADDPRAITEHSRLKQTWEELMEMAVEKRSGHTSRAASVLSTYNSSGRNSSASSSRSGNASEAKRNRYTNLSVSGRDGFLAPAMMSQRRATSASSAGSSSVKQSARPGLSTAKGANARSVSGPMKPTPPTITSRLTSTLFSSTFASRQRTSSISSNTSIQSVSKPPISRRRMSSALSETSRAASPAPSTSSRGALSRAPRQSLGSYQRAVTPERTPRYPRQKYVANPKNKLDVALGDVINNLPVDINVEAVTDTWKDKSGKYWIGGNEPKLCFCRILRSQTVMVRVGGGWTELSKFIKDHFSDLFRLLPETPPRPGSASKEQRWISATTLRNAEEESSLTKSSGSPDSIGRNVPSFAISTPDGTQKSGSPGSSPLTPLQFIRRADANASQLSLSSIALSNDLSTSGISTSSILMRPKRRMSSTSSKFAWKP